MIESVTLEFYLVSMFAANAGIAVAAFASLIWVHSSLQGKIADLRDEYEHELSRVRAEYDAAMREMRLVVAQTSNRPAGINLSTGQATGNSIVAGDNVTTNNYKGEK
jgi:hypothetical protein